MKKNFDFWVYFHPTLKKLIMELKIAALIIVVSITNVYASHSYSQTAKVSLSLKDTKLEQVLDEIERQTEFYFIFNQKEIDVNRVVDIQADSMLITDILPELFNGTDIIYEVLDKKILLTRNLPGNGLLDSTSVIGLQQKQITGTITDATGSPIPGVNIQIEGTVIGVISDAEGKYSIAIPNENAVLIFSFIGYETKKITVGTQTIVNMVLAETISSLDEIVIVGYSTQTRKSLTGAVSTINATSLSEGTSSNAITRLQGKASGISIVRYTHSWWWRFN